MKKLNRYYHHPEGMRLDVAQFNNQRGEWVKFADHEEALRTAYDNTSSLKSICPNCTRQLSGHNFDEKCSIWRRCVVIECDDFHGYSK